MLCVILFNRYLLTNSVQVWAMCPCWSQNIVRAPRAPTAITTLARLSWAFCPRYCPGLLELHWSSGLALNPPFTLPCFSAELWALVAHGGIFWHGWYQPGYLILPGLSVPLAVLSSPLCIFLRSSGTGPQPVWLLPCILPTWPGSLALGKQLHFASPWMTGC